MRKLALLTIGLVIFMYSCKNATYYSKKGNKNFIEGNFETAIQNYQQALEKGSEKASTNYQIEESYGLFGSGNYFKAVIDNGSTEHSLEFSYAEDFAPVMMRENLVITSSRIEGEIYGGSGYGFTDLYVVKSDREISEQDEGSINTLNRHEASPTLTPDGKIMVFTRSNKEEIIPFYFLDLEVTGGNSKGLDHCDITFFEDGIEVENNFTNELGHYKHQLHKDRHYEIKIEKDSFFTTSIVFNLDKNEIMKNEKNEDSDYIIKKYVKLKKFTGCGFICGGGPSADIKEILYPLGSAEITHEASKELDKLIDFLQDNPGITIELGSHTDSKGDEASNFLLSTKRSESAVNYIVDNGNIVRDRVISKAYGESRLLNRCKDGDECSEEEHQTNRRTEIKILKVENINSEKYKEYLIEQERLKREAEREARHEKMEEEALMMDELKEDIEKLEKMKLSEDDPKFKLLEKKKAKLAKIEKHFHELENEESADQEILKKEEIKNSDEFLEMQRKYEEMQKMMEEMEKNKNK